MKGYFGIGVEGISKAMNLGSLLRTAHAFGASFAFAVGGVYERAEGGMLRLGDDTERPPFV